MPCCVSFSYIPTTSLYIYPYSGSKANTESTSVYFIAAKTKEKATPRKGFQHEPTISPTVSYCPLLLTNLSTLFLLFLSPLFLPLLSLPQ